MATVIAPSSFRERPSQATGIALVEPAGEIVSQPRRLWHQLLTIEPAAFYTREGARVFRAASYLLRAVNSWRTAVEWVERGELDAVLLDLDAIDAAVSSVNVSSVRVVTLLRRAAADKHLIIGAVSRRDFAEVEDCIRAGVTVFAPASSSPMTLIQRLDAARARQAHAVRELIA